MHGTNAKGKDAMVGFFREGVLGVMEGASVENLDEVLASEFAAQATRFIISFNKKGAIAALPPDLSCLLLVESVQVWRVEVGSSLWTLPRLNDADLFDVGAIAPLGRPMPALRAMTLAGSKTTALPENLDQAANLESIVMRDVALKALPECVGRLHALRTLDIVGALRMRKLPSSMNTPLLSKLVLQAVGPTTIVVPWQAELEARIKSAGAQ